MRKILFFLARATPQFKGKFRVVRLLDALLRRLSSRRLDVRAGAVNFSLDTRNLVEFWIAYCGGYQLGLLNELIRLLRDGDVFWDIGANAGSMILPICRANPKIRAFGFEPAALPMATFIANLSLNPDFAQRITPVSAAVSSSRPSLQDFYVTRQEVNIGLGGLGVRENRQAFGVKVLTLSPEDLVAIGVEGPTVVKIDVEGHEPQVLTGLMAMPSFDRLRVIAFEKSTHCQKIEGSTLAPVIDRLVGLGFEMLTFDERKGMSRYKPSDLNQDCDLIAVRKG